MSCFKINVIIAKFQVIKAIYMVNFLCGDCVHVKCDKNTKTKLSFAH